MLLFVPESAIDYEAVFCRGGRNTGNEGFALFKCPHCGCIFLMDREDDTIYLDGSDLSKRGFAGDSNQPFKCTRCKLQVPVGTWVGPRAEERFQVTWVELSASAWSWCAAPLQHLGAEA